MLTKLQARFTGLRLRYAVFVLVAVVVAAVSVPALTAGKSDTASRSLCADFTETPGLFAGNFVTLLGVKVGKVTSVTASARSTRVRMELDSARELPADVSAMIMNDSLVNDRRVELSKPYGGGARLDTGGCIPLSRTRAPVSISDTYDAANKVVGDLLGAQQAGAPGTNRVGDAITAVDTATAGSGKQFNDLVAALGTLAGDPTAKDQQLNRLIGSVDSLSTSLVRNWPDTKVLIDNLTSGLTLLTGFSTEFGATLASLNTILPALAPIIDRYGPRLFPLLDTIVPITHQLLSRAGDIKELLSYLPTLATQLPSLIAGPKAPR